MKVGIEGTAFPMVQFPYKVRLHYSPQTCT